MEPQLLAQFPLLEETLRALGVVVWAMEEYEADDALASAAFLAQKDTRVKRVVISTRTRILLSVFSARALCNLTGAGGSNAMNRSHTEVRSQTKLHSGLSRPGR